MNEEKTLTLPLWKSCLTEMRESGMTYGSSWPVSFFEERLKCQKDDPHFNFEMIDLRDAVFGTDGYYIESTENGAFFTIPSAAEHDEIAIRFDKRVRRYAVKAIHIRAATLSNPVAELTG